MATRSLLNPHRSNQQVSKDTLKDIIFYIDYLQFMNTVRGVVAENVGLLCLLIFFFFWGGGLLLLSVCML